MGADSTENIKLVQFLIKKLNKGKPKSTSENQSIIYHTYLETGFGLVI